VRDRLKQIAEKWAAAGFVSASISDGSLCEIQARHESY
jgi:hypothetical protein